MVGLPTALRRARDGARSVLASTHLRPSGVRDDFVMVRPVYTEARTTACGLRVRRAGLLGWVALKLRGRGFLAEDMRTFAREGRAVLFSPQGEPVSWSTPGRVAPDIRSGAARHADVLDLQGGTWTLRTSTQEEREGAVDGAGPKVTLFLGLLLSVLLFALLRLRKRAVLEARRQTDDLRENEDRFQASPPPRRWASACSTEPSSVATSTSAGRTCTASSLRTLSGRRRCRPSIRPTA